MKNIFLLLILNLNINCYRVKINDKKFSTVKSDYKLIIDDNTDIRKSEKEFENSLTFNFVKFSDLPDKQPYSIVDVICYVYESNPTSIINTNTPIHITLKFQCKSLCRRRKRKLKNINK